MNWFKWKQWLLAFCVATTVNVQGATLDEWGENTPPISYQSAEEERKYEFPDWRNSHADYVRAFKNDEGYNQQCNKQMWLQLPPNETSGVYIKVTLKNSNQVDAITFQVNKQDQVFTEDGAIWINPLDCSFDGTTQSIPFGVRLTTPGTYPYTVEAYINKEDNTPVAKWDATFYFLENYPSVSVSRNKIRDKLDIEVSAGDLQNHPVKFVINQFGDNDSYQLSLTSDAIEFQGGVVSSIFNLSDRIIQCQFGTKDQFAGNCRIILQDSLGVAIASTYCKILYPFEPAEADTIALKKIVSKNSKCTDLVNFWELGGWKQDYAYDDSHVAVQWSNEFPSHVTALYVKEQKNKLFLDFEGLEYLKELYLGNNNELAPLDLSQLTHLEKVNMTGDGNLTYNEILFPIGFDKKNFNGYTVIRGIGTPYNERAEFVPTNTIVDLSKLIALDVDGNKTNFTWTKNGQPYQPVSAGENTVYLRGQAQECIHCKIYNESFPNWFIETLLLSLVHGEIKYNEEDVAGLNQLASDNTQNPELEEFIKKERWKNNELYPSDSRIGVKWIIDEENNARLSHLRLDLSDSRNQETAPTKIDLSAFSELVYFSSSSNQWVESLDFSNNEKLQELSITNANIITSLDLSNCEHLKSVSLQNNSKLETLDLSSLEELERVNLNGCSLSYADVMFPETFNKENVRGTTQIRQIGSPRNDWSVEVLINTVIDMAAYVGEPIEESTTTYSWKKNGSNVELASVKEGSFKLYGQEGDNFTCEISNDAYPNWKLQTIPIYLIQGEMIFNEQDVAGLKKLYTDNKQNEEIKTFIENEVWKKNDLYPGGPMGAKWVVDENNNARLSHLRLNLNGCDKEEIAPTKMDLSAFTELVYFNTSSNYYIDEMDFSKNTKLKEIYFEYAKTMTKIDLSPCKDLERLELNHLQVIESVNLSANTKLEYLQVWDNSKLKTLNLDNLSSMNNLRISTNQNLEQELDLSGMEVLRSLYIANCPKLTPLTGVEQLSLSSLILEHTDSLYKEALKVLDYSTITYINYQESHYDLPESAPKLSSLVVAQSTKEVDLAHFPELGSLSMGWYSGRPALPYSGIKNYRNKSYRDENGEYHSGMSYGGLSLIPVPGTEKVLGERYPCLNEGDTIDFSSEAVIEGKHSQFVWIDCDNNTEETALFVAVEDHPGVFTINPDASRNESGEYRCRIWNEAFSEGAGVDWYNGWILETERFKISNGETVYNLEELNMLQTVVEQTNCEDLKDWWEKGEWANNSNRGYWSDYDENDQYREFYFSWNENHRLQRLQIWGFRDKMTGLLNISAAEELENLTVHDTDLTNCLFPEKPKLQKLSINTSNIALPIDVEFPYLQYFYPGMAQTELDLSKLPVLTSMGLYDTHLKYSGIISPRKLENAWGDCSWDMLSDKEYNGINYMGENDLKTIDFSSETSIGATVSWKTWNADGTYVDLSLPAIETGKYNFSDALQKRKKIQAVLAHDLFPNWKIYFNAILYTEQGDANIDGTVNVQDISATIPYVLNDWNNQLPVFGYYQADIDANKAIDVADIVGILNIIRGRDYSNLRSSFSPVVHLTSEEDGKLYIQTPVALAGLQFTITGADQEVPLLGEAGRFAHAAHAGDSLRMVAYSMDGSTIPAGRTLIAQLPKGATLVEAVIADEQARSLEVDLNGVVTATEDVWSDVFADEVTNSPNPFRGQTTFRYGVNESADAVVIRIFSANGMLVRVLSGLPASQGEHQYPVSLDLPQGLYYYQLEISRGGKPIRTLSNNMIIK